MRSPTLCSAAIRSSVSHHHIWCGSTGLSDRIISSLQVLRLNPPAGQNRKWTRLPNATQPKLPCCNSARTQQSSTAHRILLSRPSPQDIKKSHPLSLWPPAIRLAGCWPHMAYFAATKKSKSPPKTDLTELTYSDVQYWNKVSFATF